MHVDSNTSALSVKVESESVCAIISSRKFTIHTVGTPGTELSVHLITHCSCNCFSTYKSIHYYVQYLTLKNILCLKSCKKFCMKILWIALLMRKWRSFFDVFSFLPRIGGSWQCDFLVIHNTWAMPDMDWKSTAAPYEFIICYKQFCFPTELYDFIFISVTGLSSTSL